MTPQGLDPFAVPARRIRLTPDMADAPVRRLIAALAGDDPRRALFVGGCVRDALLGVSPRDIDIATPMAPVEVKAALKRAGIRTVATGLAHGTLTALVGHRPFEVTSLRRDVETFGRHAKVAFGASWIEDARRRDFTINALYCSIDGDVFDPWGGLEDLENRRVRFIGDADARIREDRLRILRFFRFHARFGGATPDRAGMAACTRQSLGLKELSKERVRMELLGILAQPNSGAIFALMQRGGILRPILPAPWRAQVLERLLGFEAALDRPRREAADSKAGMMVRLAALVDSPADDLQKRLRLSKIEGERLAFLRAWPTLFPSSAAKPPRAVFDDDLRALLYRFGRERTRDALLLTLARHGAWPSWPRAARRIDREPIPVFPLRGKDISRLGYKPGPALGQTLARAEQWWIDHDYPDRDTLLDHADDWRPVRKSRR